MLDALPEDHWQTLTWRAHDDVVLRKQFVALRVHCDESRDTQRRGAECAIYRRFAPQRVEGVGLRPGTRVGAQPQREHGIRFIVAAAVTCLGAQPKPAEQVHRITLGVVVQPHAPC